MRNSTVWGLMQKSDINITYDLISKSITKVNGCDLYTDNLKISDEICFSIPLYISINNIPLFPSKYEFLNDGEIIYSHKHPPIMNIAINDDNFLSERSRTKQNTITLESLKLTDVRNRKREPSQYMIMKESAKNHAQKLIDRGILAITPNPNSNLVWHWCHLIAFSMLPTDKAQKKNNLFCGTATCNGHMVNIESAVKQFIYEFKRPLGLEVTVTTYQDTLVARRIRYSIYDKKGSKALHNEYFDALTTTKVDILEGELIYRRMVDLFNN